MKRRMHLSRKRSKRMFTKHAKRVHGRNIHSKPMRGGIRL